MINSLPTNFKAILKVFKLNDLYYYLRANFFINRVAVTLQQDLSKLPPLNDSLEKAGVKLVPIAPAKSTLQLEAKISLSYLDNNRQIKSKKYLKKGYRGFAVVEGDEVCGDIWYVCAFHQSKEPTHHDLKWLKFECGDKDVYTFDMNVHPSKRGKNLANLLQNGALHELKKNGYSRALGYYWADNLAALWVHRTLRWQELDRLKICRFRNLYFSHVIEPCNGSKKAHWLSPRRNEKNVHV